MGLDDNVYDAVDVDTPFKHKEFQLPKYQRAYAFMNFKTIDIYRDFYSDQDIPLDHRIKVTGSFYEVLKKNPCNYFIVISRCSLLLEMVESLSRVPQEVAAKVLDIIQYVSLDLKYIPHKELMLLFVQLHDVNDAVNTPVIIRFLMNMILQDASLVSHLKDLGIVSDLTVRLNAISDMVNRGETVPDYVSANFERLCELMSFLFADQESIAVFRDRCSLGLYDLVHKTVFQKGTLCLIEKMCQMEETEPACEFEGLVRLLQSPAMSASDIINILSTIQSIFNYNSKKRDQFRLYKGFEFAHQVLLRVAKEPTSDDELEGLLKHWFAFIISSIEKHQPNRNAMERQSMTKQGGDCSD